jgi:hypothetical protein
MHDAAADIEALKDVIRHHEQTIAEMHATGAQLSYRLRAAELVIDLARNRATDYSTALAAAIRDFDQLTNAEVTQ